MRYASGRRHAPLIRYSVWGPETGPTVVALGGISADRRPDQWWSEVFGTGRALDPGALRIIGLDWLAQRWPDGRVVTTDQQAAALSLVLDDLGIARVDTLLGASYGAMVSLAFAARYPSRVGRLVAISGAHEAHPMAVARRVIQRQIVELGDKSGRAEEGLSIARALALTTYRPDSLFEQRFSDRDADKVLGELEGYFSHQAERFCRQFDCERYLCLSESLDRHRVRPEAVICPVDLVAVKSDALVPPAQLQALARQLGKRCRYHEIDSAYGHDAFLKEGRLLNPLIGDVLKGDRP